MDHPIQPPPLPPPPPPLPVRARTPVPPASAFPMLSAPPPPPKKSGMTPVAALAGVMAFLMMGFVGKVVVRNLVKARAAADVERSLRSDSVDPYVLMASNYKRNPTSFRTGFSRGVALGLRQNVPGGNFTVDEQPVIDDVGKAMRSVVGYTGDVPGPDGERIALRGELRQYVHSGGMVMVETACFSDTSMCLELDEFVSRADATVLANLNGASARSLLPPDSTCQRQPAPYGRDALICKLSDEMVVTFQKLTLAQTRTELRRISGDAAFQKLLRD